MGLFERLLARHERERHWRALASRRPWPGQYASDEGFMPPGEAAAAMGMTELELARTVRRGLLEHRVVAGDVLVRPAIVSVLAVRETPVQIEGT